LGMAGPYDGKISAKWMDIDEDIIANVWGKSMAYLVLSMLVVDSPFGPGVDPGSLKVAMNEAPNEHTALLRRTSTLSTKQRRDPTEISASRRRGIL
ncbi:hypothetical protein, partial [Novilysobacter selenitireducens]